MNPVVTNPKLLISFLHQTTTNGIHRTTHKALLLISFLHQTQPAGGASFFLCHCFLSHFYIKPQLEKCFRGASYDCFLSHFYIKPQLAWGAQGIPSIASYLISTSNHNSRLEYSYKVSIASYLISTSNHNRRRLEGWARGIASYLISTSNHNSVASRTLSTWLLLISFLHQTTTLLRW